MDWRQLRDTSSPLRPQRRIHLFPSSFVLEERLSAAAGCKAQLIEFNMTRLFLALFLLVIVVFRFRSFNVSKAVQSSALAFNNAAQSYTWIQLEFINPYFHYWLDSKWLTDLLTFLRMLLWFQAIQLLTLAFCKRIIGKMKKLDLSVRRLKWTNSIQSVYSNQI